MIFFMSLKLPCLLLLHHLFSCITTFLTSGMSIFRFSAEFHFVFSLSTFLKMIFRFFGKIAKKKTKTKKKCSCTDTTTIDCSKSFGKQSVTSWFAGMRFFHFRSKFESTNLHSHSESEYSDARSHAACWCTAWTSWTWERGGWWFSGGMEDGLKVIARILPVELKHLHPAFSSHHFTLSLSLSHAPPPPLPPTTPNWHSGLSAATISP